jgi:cytochrome c5
MFGGHVLAAVGAQNLTCQDTAMPRKLANGRENKSGDEGKATPPR